MSVNRRVTVPVGSRRRATGGACDRSPCAVNRTRIRPARTLLRASVLARPLETKGDTGNVSAVLRARDYHFPEDTPALRGRSCTDGSFHRGPGQREERASL